MASMYGEQQENAQDEAQTPDDLAVWIRQSLTEAKRHSGQWRVDARTWYDFYAGRQWTDEDKATLAEKDKVPVVFNRVARLINAVAGLEVQNRQEVQYLPRGVDDQGLADLYNAAGQWVRDQCDAEDEDSEAFQDCAISGMGWSETRLDYDDDPDGRVIVERVDPLEAFWDPAAKKKNLRDARWMARVKKVSPKQVRDMFPDWAGSASDVAGESLVDEQDTPHDATPPFYDKEQPGQAQPKTVELVCFEWFEQVTIYRIAQPDGSVRTLDSREYDEARWERLRARIEAMGMQWVKQRQKVYRIAYLVGNEVLEERELEVQRSGFRLKCMTGARDRNAGTWFGLVALSLDPQRWANKWLSEIVHSLKNSAQGGLLAEKGAFSSPSRAEETWAKADRITWTEDGAISGSKIQPKPSAPMPEGYGRMLEFAVNSIADVPGLSMELLGVAQKDQPGVLEHMRKQAGVTILATLFDSMRLYRKEHGRMMMEYVRNYLSDGRLVRIMGDEGARYVPLIRDQMAAEYDVVVDESPTSPNNKERVFGMMVQLAPILQQSGIGMPPDILEYSPLPASLVEKWKRWQAENKQMPPEVQAAVQQMQTTIQGLQAQMGKLAEENLKLKTSAQVDVYKISEQAKVDRELAILKAQSEAENRSVKVYEANLKAMMERMALVADTVSQNMRSAVESSVPRTEQAVGRLGSDLLPALQQLMALSQQQVDMSGQFQTGMDRMAQQITQGIAQALAGNRVVSAVPQYDPGTNRLRAIRRTYGDGSTDEMPYGGGMSVQ